MLIAYPKNTHITNYFAIYNIIKVDKNLLFITRIDRATKMKVGKFNEKLSWNKEKTYTRHIGRMIGVSRKGGLII